MSMSNIPHLDQYLGPWAMLESNFQAAVDYVSRLDLAAHVQASQALASIEQAEPTQGYKVEDQGVAVIELVGTMTKYGSSLLDGPSTVSVRRVLRNALEDSSVKAIMFLVDSPGGSTNGVQDLADDVRAANAKKPVTAYIEDMGASSAYWVASQAGRIIANSAALVGAIGTYGVVRDFSEQEKMLGIKTHIIKAGEFKGAGEPGAPVDDEQLAEFQRVVAEVNELFVGSVAQGRGISRERALALADGRAHIGERARKLGLVDAIETFDAALDALATQSKSVLATGATTMTACNDDGKRQSQTEEPKKKPEDEEVESQEETEEEKRKRLAQEEKEKKEEEARRAQEDKDKKNDEQSSAASVNQLRAALPENVSADFVLACVEQGLSTQQAAAMWKQQASGSTSRFSRAPGGPGLPEGDKRKSTGSGDFVADAQAYAKEHNCSVRQAMSTLAGENPEAHAAWVESQVPQRISR